MAFLEKVNLGAETLGLISEPKMPPTPFVFRRGIEADWSTDKKPINIERLLADVQKNHLTTRDLNIVEALFRHKYLTSYHLGQLFFGEQSRKIVTQRLDKLHHLQLIQKFGWRINGHLTKTHAYCLNEGGAALLEAYRNRELNGWSSFQNIKALSYVFRLLMANEIYVKLVHLTRFLDEGEGLNEFVLEPSLQISDKKHHQVQPTAKFSYQRKGKLIEFLLEVVRETDIEYIPAKLRKLNEWYLFKNLKVPPVLFILVESESQALQIGKIIEALGLTELQKWARYSTDLRISSELLHHAFFKLSLSIIEVVPTKIFDIGQ